MSKAICYSLFGYGKPRQDHSFDFNSYLRDLMTSIRMNRLIYPDYRTVLNTDSDTYEAFKDLLLGCDIDLYINEPAPLCKAMLWRLKPIYTGKYTHVLCRDLDSPVTVREAKCVKYWENKGKAIHAITDSVSHNIPMMGGMIGIRVDLFLQKMPNSWDALMSMASYDYNRKGTDQEFLNRVIYPVFAKMGEDSITQHYLKGYANTFLSDWHNEVPEYIDLGLPAALNESNDTCGHIGSAGAYSSSLFKFLRKYWHNFDDLLALEAKHPNIFYWVNE